jgi:hypothetical protein
MFFFKSAKYSAAESLREAFVNYSFLPTVLNEIALQDSEPSQLRQYPVVLSMWTYPEPHHRIVGLCTECTPANCDAHGIHWFDRMYLLELKARVIWVRLPKAICFPRLTLNTSRKLLKGFPESLSRVRSHYPLLCVSSCLA